MFLYATYLREQHKFEEVVNYRKSKVSLRLSTYRNFLARSVLLKVPNGAIWPVKLTRSDGSTWLQKGWLELADFNSLEQGYFLFFSYEGDVFNKNSMEIEYPFKSSHHEEHNLGGGMYENLVYVIMFMYVSAFIISFWDSVISCATCHA